MDRICYRRLTHHLAVQRSSIATRDKYNYFHAEVSADVEPVCETYATSLQDDS